MQESLGKAKVKYALKGDELEKTLAASEPSPWYYAATLVASELSAIFLYELGIEFVLAKVDGRKKSSQGVSHAEFN